MRLRRAAILHLCKRIGAVPEALLPFAQAILAIFAQGREQIADDAALAGFDLGGDGHARREANLLVLDLHLHTVQRDARRVHGSLIVGGCFYSLAALLTLFLGRVQQVVLAELVVLGAPVFGRRLRPRLLDGRHRRRALVLLTLLYR